MLDDGSIEPYQSTPAPPGVDGAASSAAAGAGEYNPEQPQLNPNKALMFGQPDFRCVVFLVVISLG